MILNPTGQLIECLNRKTPPPDHYNIIDDLYLKDNDAIDQVINVSIYFRPKEDCPFDRGNWIIDILFDDNNILCIKLPKDMEAKKVEKFAQPLIDFIKNKAQ